MRDVTEEVTTNMMFGLQRKLRAFEKKHDPIHKSLDDTADVEIQLEMQKPKSVCSDDESVKAMTILSGESTETKSTPQVRTQFTIYRILSDFKNCSFRSLRIRPVQLSGRTKHVKLLQKVIIPIKFSFMIPVC